MYFSIILEIPKGSFTFGKSERSLQRQLCSSSVSVFKGKRFPRFFLGVLFLKKWFWSFPSSPAPRWVGILRGVPKASCPGALRAEAPVRWFPSIETGERKASLQPCFVNNTLTRSQPSAMSRPGSGTRSCRARLLSGQTRRLPVGLPSPAAAVCSKALSSPGISPFFFFLKMKRGCFT